MEITQPDRKEVRWDSILAQDSEPVNVDELIEKIAKKVLEIGMEAPVILALESAKPLSFIGSQMGRAMIAPWFGIFGWDAMTKADIYMEVFEDRKNVEKLVRRIEELAGISDRLKKERKGK
jgi:hypothetical protein